MNSQIAKKEKPKGMNIRWMFRSDIETVSQIRNDFFEDDLLNILSSPSCILKVAELDSNVLGFVAYKNGRKKIRIIEFAVSAHHRRSGVASALIRCIISKAEGSSKKIEVLVSETNLNAQMFLKKCGFKASKILRSNDESHYKFTMDTKCQKECF